MLIIVLAVCAGLTVLVLDFLYGRLKPAKPVKVDSRPSWLRVDYLGDLRRQKLTPEELADLKALTEDACKYELSVVIEDFDKLSAEDKLHIKSCPDCQSILDLYMMDKYLPE